LLIIFLFLSFSANLGLLWLKDLVSLYYDETMIKANNRTSVETSSTSTNLTIIDVQGSDAGVYSCQLATRDAQIQTFYNLIVAGT